jgi:outer membrane protein assembly factor BamD (BamD/ComL family)
MGDFEKAYEKAKQLVFEYPDSVYAQKAKEFLPNLKQKVASGEDAG